MQKELNEAADAGFLDEHLASLDRRAVGVAAHLGQAVGVREGGDADLGREGLHEHRHQVRGDDHPYEHEAVLGAALDVRGEVARVDVGDGGHERGPEQREPAAQTPARADAAEH